jgi:hypothetical protein
MVELHLLPLRSSGWISLRRHRPATAVAVEAHAVPRRATAARSLGSIYARTSNARSRTRAQVPPSKGDHGCGADHQTSVLGHGGMGNGPRGNGQARGHVSGASSRTWYLLGPGPVSSDSDCRARFPFVCIYNTRQPRGRRSEVWGLHPHPNPAAMPDAGGTAVISIYIYPYLYIVYPPSAGVIYDTRAAAVRST